MANVKGRSVLVTGGGSGIGLATARRMLEAGARVAIAGRDLPRLERAAAASFAEGATPADEAQPDYTNIFSMRLVNLLLFAQVTGNATTRAQALEALSASDPARHTRLAGLRRLMPVKPGGALALLDETLHRRECRIDGRHRRHATDVGRLANRLTVAV